MPNEAVSFFAVPHPGLYLLGLALSFAVSGLWLVLAARKRGLPRAAAPVCLMLALLLGGFLARLLYLAVEVGEWPFIVQMFFRPEDAREFGFAGAALGLMAAVWATQKLLKADGLSEAAALPALLMAMLARLCEVFVPFGTGEYVETPLLQWVPAALPDGFGSWLLSVFLLEGLWALWSLFFVRGFSRRRFAAAVLCYHAGQMFLESLRAESLRWGFIRVSQLIAACVLFALLWYAGRGQKKQWRRMAVFLGCIALYIGCEFGLDRLPWPHYILRTAMLAVSALIFRTLLGAVRSPGGHTSERIAAP